MTNNQETQLEKKLPVLGGYHDFYSEPHTAAIAPRAAHVDSKPSQVPTLKLDQDGNHNDMDDIANKPKTSKSLGGKFKIKITKDIAEKLNKERRSMAVLLTNAQANEADRKELVVPKIISQDN